MVKQKDRKSRYFSLKSLSDALSLMQKRYVCNSRISKVPVQDSCGKITAEAIYSPISIPSAHLSAMDGIAVKSRDTIGATDQRPVEVTDFALVNTGNVIPDGYDAVIMIEDVEEQNGSYLVRSPVPLWHHIRPVGEDIAQYEMILPRLTRIRAMDIGAMANFGISHVPVLDLRVALIPTGSEIVPIGSTPAPGQVIESNMHMGAALIRETGVSVTHYPPVPDDRDKIRAAIKKAAYDHDIILISAGSSKGTKDYTADIISELGEVFVHGVAIKPAKPVIIGEINHKPVIGLPGYPIACYTIIREFVYPLLTWYGFPLPGSDLISAHLTSPVQSQIGTDEFVLATVGNIQDRWVAVPLSRGSGVQMTMVRSNAYLKIPAEIEGLEAGSAVSATLTVEKRIADQVVLITGSHDPSVDYLADLVRNEGIMIASSHVGSMGGLLTLKRGDCHLAPMHLLAEDDEYNIPYLKKYLPEEELVLICVGERIQGIASREALGFDDITRYRFINRQRGSGTRMLLDNMLRKKQIDPEKISGYDREVTNHLAVCLAIQSGDADLGLTTYSAARSFSLQFIPVGLERYELVTTSRLFGKDPRVKKIAEMIASTKFKEVLIHLGGYETENTGHIRRCNKT